MSWRHYLLFVVFFAGIGLLGVRVVALAFDEREFLQKQGDARAIREESITAQRGVIRDRWGEPLAVSTPAYNVWVDPGVRTPPVEKWQALAGVLQLDIADLTGKLQQPHRRYVLLKRRITWDAAQELKALDIEGINLTTVYRRYYPAGEVAAHVVGYSGLDDNMTEETGREGIERAFDDQLRAVPGRKVVLRDRKGQNVRDLQYLAAPKEGKDLTLSLDLRLQYLAYRELKAAVMGHNARSGSLVMLDVRTGDILALVNQPSYNPNEGIPEASVGLRNIAITDPVEPGSTAKPFTAIAGLESTRYSPDSEFDTAPGYITVRGKTVKDARNYGLLTLTGVLQKSSQVGIIKLALDLPRDAVYKTLVRAGVGEPVSSGLPGEYAGRISPEGLRSDLVRINMAYGYAFNVSTLQLARAYLTLARSGNKPAVSILRSESAAQGEQVYDAKVARTVLEMLESVTEDAGTASGAQVEGYRVAGKTGTARVISDGAYDDKKHIALFAGVVPLTNPELVMIVVIHEPSRGQSGGGAVAAPVFARVAERSLRLLGIPGDAPPPMTADSNKDAVVRPRSST